MIAPGIAPGLPATVAVCAFEGVGLIASPEVCRRRPSKAVREIDQADADGLAGGAILETAHVGTVPRNYDAEALAREYVTRAVFAAAFPEIAELAPSIGDNFIYVIATSNFSVEAEMLSWPAMKFVLFGVFVFFFVVLPLYMLSSVVMPELDGLQKTYAGQVQTVQAMFPQP